MTPNKQRLMDDLWVDETGARRASILSQGGTILRRRRRIRIVVRLTGCMAIAAVPLLAWHLTIARHTAPVTQMARAASRHLTAQPLTDDQLLALFPNTPVGLTTVHGKKHLIFPRPADEQKYVVHLDIQQPQPSAPDQR